MPRSFPFPPNCPLSWAYTGISSTETTEEPHFFAESIREAERRELSGEMGMVDLDGVLAGKASRRAERRMVEK